MEFLTPIEAEVEAWLTGMVIGLNLCPFAAPFVRQRLVRTVVCEARAASPVLGTMIDEILAMTAESAAHRTTLVVVPFALPAFDDFLELVAQTDALIDQIGLRGVVQLAHFHPDYLFDGVPAEDHGHWTNRAPYPILHLLREDDVATALARYPDADGIPARNVERLRTMTLDAIRRAVRGPFFRTP